MAEQVISLGLIRYIYPSPSQPCPIVGFLWPEQVTPLGLVYICPLPYIQTYPTLRSYVPSRTLHACIPSLTFTLPYLTPTRTLSYTYPTLPYTYPTLPYTYLTLPCSSQLRQLLSETSDEALAQVTPLLCLLYILPRYY